MTSGSFIAVVGPSGVGKDAILDGARSVLAGDAKFHFAKRTISRPAGAGGEDHIAVSAKAFAEKREAGEFCLCWQAHGLHYGVSADMQSLVADGVNVICNVSRKQVAGLDQLFGRTAVIEITASPDIIRKRLEARGRENADEIAKRATRDVGSDWLGKVPHFQVSNDESLDSAVATFVELVVNLSDRTALSA